MGAEDVEQAVAEMVRALGPHVAGDWRRPAGTLEWDCWTTAAHVAHDLLAYAGQVAARPDDGAARSAACLCGTGGESLLGRESARPHRMLFGVK